METATRNLIGLAVVVVVAVVTFGAIAWQPETAPVDPAAAFDPDLISAEHEMRLALASRASFVGSRSAPGRS
jgi:hypothetical protein